MSLGLAIAIFLAIGVVVMALFCLVTRHFNKKLQKALEDQNQVYSMIEEIRGKEQNEEDDGQYENYMNLREKKVQSSSRKNQPFQIQMTEIKEPLKGFGGDIYGGGRLRRRLEGQQAVTPNAQTGRSMGSIRSFKPQKIESKRTPMSLSNRSRTTGSDDDVSDGGELKDPSVSKRSTMKKKKQNLITSHKYINKLVGYTEQGISVIENDVKTIIKRDQVQQRRNIKKTQIKPEYTVFNDTLQAYGFQKAQFCAFKFQSTLQIPNMKEGQQYPVHALKSTESKEQIEFAEFYTLKDQLQEKL